MISFFVQIERKSYQTQSESENLPIQQLNVRYVQDIVMNHSRYMRQIVQLTDDLTGANRNLLGAKLEGLILLSSLFCKSEKAFYIVFIYIIHLYIRGGFIMFKKKMAGILACTLTLSLLVGCSNKSTPSTTTEAVSTTNESTQEANTSEGSYTPVTITVDLLRSGLGDKIEQTFTKAPTKAVAIGDQMGDILLDLGIENNMAALARGSAISMHDFPGRNSIGALWEGGRRDISREQLLSVSPDFLIGWDSTFAEDYYNKDFCKENGIAMYTPYCTTDFATFEDIYKDYETLGKIFDVETVAEEKISAMKEKVASVQKTLGEDAYANPVTIFNFDSGEEAPFTACQGMPGDIFKLAGGISIFDDIDKGWATVSWEQVVERNPQVFIVNEYSDGEAQNKIDFINNNPALSNVDAVVNHRIFAVNLSDLEGSCGSADMVEEIASNLYPDLF